jgi:hypothetical protein
MEVIMDENNIENIFLQKNVEAFFQGTTTAAATTIYSAAPSRRSMGYL